MSDHETKPENDPMANEDSVKAEEEKPKEKEENEKEPVKEEEEEEMEGDEEEEKEEEEEESKETEPEEEEEEKDEEEEEEEPKEVNEVKEEEEASPKEKKQKQKKEEVPVKEAPSTPKKEVEVPLYDQPLEMSGKRDRKKVERFVQETKKEELNVTGNGVPLGEIPYIEDMITKMGFDELKVLHRVAYSRPGSGSEIKKNLRRFNGFPYTKEDKKYQSKLFTVERILMSEIKRMLMVLGLERSGNKGEVVERLMAFMMHPEDTGKKVRTPGKKGKPRGRSSKKSLEKKQNNTTQDDSEGSRSDSNQSASEQEDGEEEEDEEEPEEKPKKTPGRKPAAKKTPGKRTPAAKKTPASKRGKPAPASDDSDSDDEPLAKKVKQPPSDAELKVMVKKILEGANLEEVTMKSVCRQVYDSYPDFDLAHKKLFIKETVKSIIS